MPQTNEVILEKVQAGLEVTRGTDVAATRKVYARAVGSFDRELRTIPVSTGTFAGSRVASLTPANIGFTFEEQATFEDLPWWFQMALKGGVAGVTDGGSPPAYTYTFLPTITSDDLKSFTMEHGEVGVPYESHQNMVDEWSLKIDPDNEGAWVWNATTMAIDWASGTYTGAIGERTVEIIPAPGTKLFIDAAGGTIGTTQVTGKLISATISGKNNIHFKRFSEDVVSYPANKVGRGELEFNAEIVLEHDSDGEFANYRNASAAPVQRLIRFESSNAVAIHGTPNTFKRARLDINGFWSSWSPGDRDGNKIYTLNLMGIYDATSTYMLKAEVVNALSALP